MCPVAPASPQPDSRAVQPGRGRSEQGATVKKWHEKKENQQPTPVKPLWCALLFQLVLSQCTGSPSLPHILAPLLLDPAGDCKAFIHIYHWGTQAAYLTNRREKGSSVLFLRRKDTKKTLVGLHNLQTSNYNLTPAVTGGLPPSWALPSQRRVTSCNNAL